MTEQTLAAEPINAKKEDLYSAKPWRLIWRRFSKHVLAVISLWFLVILALTLVQFRVGRSWVHYQ